LLPPHKYLRYRQWLRTRLSPYLVDAAAESRGSSLWNHGTVSTLVREHIRGLRNHSTSLGHVLTLSAVERLLLKRQRVAVLAADSWEPVDALPMLTR
jgi:hypothetical protein